MGPYSDMVHSGYVVVPDGPILSVHGLDLGAIQLIFRAQWTNRESPVPHCPFMAFLFSRNTSNRESPVPHCPFMAFLLSRNTSKTGETAKQQTLFDVQEWRIWPKAPSPYRTPMSILNMALSILTIDGIPARAPFYGWLCCSKGSPVRFTKNSKNDRK